MHVCIYVIRYTAPFSSRFVLFWFVLTSFFSLLCRSALSIVSKNAITTTIVNYVNIQTFIYTIYNAGAQLYIYPFVVCLYTYTYILDLLWYIAFMHSSVLFFLVCHFVVVVVVVIVAVDRIANISEASRRIASKVIGRYR